MKINQFLRTRAVRVTFALALIVAVFTASACEEKQLKAIASNISRIETLIESSRKVRDTLVAGGQIDATAAYDATRGLQKVNNALGVFNSKARAYQAAGTLTPEVKTDLSKLAGDISSALAELAADGTLGIKNESARQNIVNSINAINSVVQELINTINTLKPKAQQAAMAPLALAPLLLQLLAQIMGAARNEAALKGKTEEEIFEENGVRIDATKIALAADLVKYAPTEEVSAEAQANLDALTEHLTQFKPVA